MTDTEANRRIHPAILTRAKELRRPMTPQENKLWQRLRAKQCHALKFQGEHPLVGKGLPLVPFIGEES